MNTKSKVLSFCVLGAIAAPNQLFGDTIYIEDFEDAVVGYTLTDLNGDALAEFSDGGSDFFLRTDGTGISGGYSVTGFGGTSFFAGQDLDGDGELEPFTQLFAGIDIAGITDLGFSVLLAEDDDGSNQDWDENDDIVSFEYQIDNGGFVSIFDVLPSGTGFNSAPAVGTTEVTSTFAEFTGSITETGNLLDLRITWDLDSGDEDLAIDNVTITGIPEPASLALIGLGGLAMLGRGRRQA